MKILRVIKTGIKDLMASYATLDPGCEYGNRANAIFQVCSITFEVDDLRGLEIFAAKEISSLVTLTTPLEQAFSTFKSMRPVIFSKKYPRVTETEEYKKFNTDAARVKMLNSKTLDINQEYRNLVDAHILNFAGSIAFSAKITFSGPAITRILGIYPEKNLRNANGTFIDPEDVQFDNYCIARFVDVFYECMRNTFTSMDIFTAVTMGKRYFSVIKDGGVSVFASKFISPFGEIKLQGSSQDIIKNNIQSLVDNSGFVSADAVIKTLSAIVHMRCSVQSLLILLSGSDMVTYFTDIKDVIGTTIDPQNVLLPDCFTNDSIDGATKLYGELVPIIEDDRAVLLEAMRKNTEEIEKYKDRKNRDGRSKPVELINKTEYLNVVPLYARTCVTLNISLQSVEDMPEVNTETATLKKYVRAVSNIICDHIRDYYESKDPGDTVIEG